MSQSILGPTSNPESTVHKSKPMSNCITGSTNDTKPMSKSMPGSTGDPEPKPESMFGSVGDPETKPESMSKLKPESMWVTMNPNKYWYEDGFQQNNRSPV